MNPDPSRRSHKEPSDQPPLPERTRIKMSALGATRCPNLAGRQGVIIGSGRYRSTVRVMFDDFKSPTSLHSTYIEPVVEEDQAPHRGRSGTPRQGATRANAGGR
ncbi:hypothetical protein IVB22_13790 [Bradyrhizobium sp. 190]|uniref:hypothetical protein n=1 Tax=Bradyrhizobium sp. 190 TaxID=2782658 RepID=UPI001FF8F616|nr:hypothetical protein [Bradyrhizobium sp. 190]MCK1513623.1 hypothetical protein [Bradyrhizobium sp. 190]